MSYKDRKPLLGEPGAGAKAGTLKAVKASREAFNTSIGHGAPAGGSGQDNGVGGTGDPTISYPVATTWAKPLGRVGKFSTADQVGKQPLNYDESLDAYMKEY